MKLKVSIFLFGFLCPFLLISQSKNILERLGFDKNTKLLIIHADDIGVAHSQNAATIKAFENKTINSASIMVPCPWFPEIANFAKNHMEYDIGLHLTLNSEWKYYRWGGVSSANEIPSLLDSDGFFYRSVEEVVKNAKPEEVEKELFAQIKRALDFGIKPTHLDSHMGALFATPELFKIYLNLGKKFNLPVFIPQEALKRYPEYRKTIEKQQFLVDNYFMMNVNRPKSEWNDFYLNVLKQLKPGLNELIVHLAFDNSETRAIMVDHNDFGAIWRQNDFDSMMSKDFKEAIIKYNIRLISWKDLNKILKQLK